MSRLAFALLFFSATASQASGHDVLVPLTIFDQEAFDLARDRAAEESETPDDDRAAISGKVARPEPAPEDTENADNSTPDPAADAEKTPVTPTPEAPASLAPAPSPSPETPS